MDGAIGTLKYFAKLGAGLGNAKILIDASPGRLTRDPNFQAAHFGVPLRGVAVHINAYNFPAWGLWEKAAVSLLAGMPVISKPATSTVWLAQEMVSQVIEGGILPEGSLSIICGSVHDLFEYLKTGDVICFTGSAETARTVRGYPTVEKRGIRLNVEADSLNATILGPDVTPGSQIFEFLVREAVKEMTVKAGQKCTAIRRILAPERHARATTDAVSAQLQQIKIGDPANTSVNMGPLVSMSQRLAVESGIRKLARVCEIVYQKNPLEVLDANSSKGAFVGPTLLSASSPDGAQLWNELEIFGPVASILSYSDKSEAFSIAARGGGSLAVSVFSEDPAFLAEAAEELGGHHGRILLVDPSIANSHTGHGIVMPSCIHGGPGRAGGGEELGAYRGLWFYHQKVAVQGSATVLTNLVQQAVNPAVTQS